MAGANPKMGLVEWTLLIVLAMVWGGSFFFAKVAVAEVPPLSIVAVRVSLAAAVLIVVVHIAGHRMPATFAGWAPFLAMGVVNNAIPFSLIFWAQATIASGLASVLNATMPIFTAPIS